MNARFAALTCGAVLTVTALGPAAAQASPSGPSTHGCPAGDVCGYESVNDYDSDTVLWLKNIAEFALPWSWAHSILSSASTTVIVNNTNTAHSSEGNYVLNASGRCVYRPDANDGQGPTTTQVLAGGRTVTAAVAGPTAASVTRDIAVNAAGCR